jgi:ribosomal-protein-alanine acetyltransferase
VLQPAVHRATLDDLDELARLALEAGETTWRAETFYPACRGDEKERAFIARDGDIIVGYAVMALEVDDCALYSIAIKPSHRRRGLAQILFNAGVSWAREAGTTRCLLEVRVSNTSAIQLYEKLGFKRDGIRKNYYPTQTSKREDALLMSLDLED